MNKDNFTNYSFKLFKRCLEHLLEIEDCEWHCHDERNFSVNKSRNRFEIKLCPHDYAAKVYRIGNSSPYNQREEMSGIKAGSYSNIFLDAVPIADLSCCDPEMAARLNYRCMFPLFKKMC